jgi:flagellar hook-basal body complex protein FliE
MRLDAFLPDAAEAPVVSPLAPAAAGARGDAFTALVDAAASALGRADAAEAAFAAHRGGMQEMVVERARADIALQIAAAGVQRATQGLQTLLGMQV